MELEQIYTTLTRLSSSSFLKLVNFAITVCIKGIFLHQCFSDTFDWAFDIEVATELHISQHKNFHNKIMWNKPDDLIHPVFIRFANEQIAKESSIHIDNSYVGGLSINNQNRQTFSNYKDTAITVTNSYIAP